MEYAAEPDDLPAPELWGGAECTVARVGDRWGDQSHLSGHHGRDGDLSLFAGLGCRALRYPVLWERVAPDRPDDCDWSWTDRRLGSVRNLGMRPIAGLLHHGSGPHYTGLLDPGFPAKLGAYAGRVARRYPWVTDYTPVNEPLTTARFSALYGHWYPHHRDEGSFWTALVNQVDGTGQAMRAIREVTPEARLIATDDLGRTYATAPLFGQAAFDNTRRWAGWDLMFGRVVPGHPLWDRLVGFGLADRLEAIAGAPCPPGIVGVNHYLTSDRFLDHRVQLYPAHTHGSNYHGRFADVEAIRVLEPAPGGLAGALREAWQRYRTPLAITEVHLGCTREEQLRWVGEAWDTARALRAEGVDLRAVTAWAMLGSHGWNTLLTAKGVYEPGLFDVGGPEPRPTALATAWTGLPLGAERHPVAHAPGWWRRPTRLAHPPVRRPARFERAALEPPRSDPAPPLLVLGAGSTLARTIMAHCDARAIAAVAADRSAATGAGALLDRHRPWAVIDAAVPDPSGVARSAALARAAAARDVPVLHFSTGYVFAGETGRCYLETDEPDPRTAHGRAQAAVDRAVLAVPGKRLVIRSGERFGPDDDDGLLAAALRALGAGGRFAAAEDRLVTPAYTPALVDAALDLLIDGAEGVWHLAHAGPVSAAEFTRMAATACGFDPGRVDGVPGAASPDLTYAGALGTGRGVTLGTLDAALARYARDRAQRVGDAARHAA